MFPGVKVMKKLIKKSIFVLAVVLAAGFVLAACNMGGRPQTFTVTYEVTANNINAADIGYHIPNHGVTPIQTRPLPFSYTFEVTLASGEGSAAMIGASTPIGGGANENTELTARILVNGAVVRTNTRHGIGSVTTSYPITN